MKILVDICYSITILLVCIILEADILDYTTRASIAQLLYTISIYDYHSQNLSIYHLTSFGKILPRVLLLG